MTIDQLYSQASILSVADQLRLVERVVHSIAVSAIEPRPTLDVIGMFSGPEPSAGTVSARGPGFRLGFDPGPRTFGWHRFGADWPEIAAAALALALAVGSIGTVFGLLRPSSTLPVARRQQFR